MKKYIVDGIEFKGDRIANLDDLTPCPCDEGETYKHELTGFLLADGSGQFGYVMAIAFAKYLQEALDIAADAELLNSIKCDDNFDPEDRYASLGNYCDLYDLQNLVAIEFDVTNGMERYLSHD
jgi:hypothetical protein